MSAQGGKRFARMLQGLLGYVLAVLLTVSLTAACGLALVNSLLTDQALHERVAQDERLLDAQMSRIGETVREMAQKHSFTPEAALEVISHEHLAAYNREMAAWWMGLTREHPLMDAPLPDTAAIEEAIREDELFRENTSDYLRRTIARDDVAYPIGLAIREAVMPLRVSLIAIVMPKVAERVDIPALVRLPGMARTALFVASGVLLALMLLTLGKRRWLFASAGFMAAFALMAVMTAAAGRMPGAMAEYSTLLSLQLTVLMGRLTLPVLMTEAAVLLAAILFLALSLAGRGGRGEAYRGKHERKNA